MDRWSWARGPVRTGVTVIRPHEGQLAEEPVFAGVHTLNGNGEVTGLQWMRQSGQLTSAIGLTNSHSVGLVRDTLAAIDCESRQPGHLYWSLPVAGETWDGILNDINGQHVRPSTSVTPTTPPRRGPWPRAASAAAPA